MYGTDSSWEVNVILQDRIEAVKTGARDNGIILI